MSKTSDIVEPVLDALLSDISTDTPAENTTSTVTPTTMNTANASEMNELDELIQKLHDERRELKEPIREIEEKKECNTEKQIYLRNIRHKKLEVTKELCEALERRSQREYDSIYNKKIQEYTIRLDIKDITRLTLAKIINAERSEAQ